MKLMLGEKTVVDTWVGKPFIGYVISARFSKENAQKLELLINKFSSELPQVIWPMPIASLHITLLDWIAPLVDYSEDKDKLFEKNKDQFDSALDEILSKHSKIAVSFKKIKVFPNAIVILGEDDGSFKEIRGQFLSRVKLVPNTKLPPKIIHSTLCRFKKEIDLKRINDMAVKENIDFIQVIESFSLHKTYREPMLNTENLKTYKLR